MSHVPLCNGNDLIFRKCGFCDYDTVQCYRSPTEVQNLCFFGSQPYGKIIPTLILMRILHVHNVWKSVLNIAKLRW